MDSLIDIRKYTDNEGVWLSVMDIAKKIGRTNSSLGQQAIKIGVLLKNIPNTKGKAHWLRVMKESDVPKLLSSLRVTGEFADAFKQIKESVISKGLEAIKPTKHIKHFQRFPDPTAIVPEKPIRACIVEYVRKVAITLKVHYSTVFNTLYTEFKYRHGIDLQRHKGYSSAMEKCFELEKCPDLYSLARAMFDSKLPEDDLILPEAEEDYEKLPSTCNGKKCAH